MRDMATGFTPFLEALAATHAPKEEALSDRIIAYLAAAGGERSMRELIQQIAPRQPRAIFSAVHELRTVGMVDVREHGPDRVVSLTGDCGEEAAATS